MKPAHTSKGECTSPSQFLWQRASALQNSNNIEKGLDKHNRDRYPAHGNKLSRTTMFGLGPKTITELNLNLPAPEARKRARILVIDDDKNAFPITLLEKEGYNVHYWAKVESIRKLEEAEYDIIILDIKDICTPEVSLRDGFGVLEHLKKYNPAQIVVAYSGQSYDLSQQKFFQIADDFLGKPSDLLECKQKIDRLLKQRSKHIIQFNSSHLYY